VSAAVGRAFEMSDDLDLVIDLEAYYQYFTVDEDDMPKIPSAVEDDAKHFALMVNGTLEWSLTQTYGVYAGVGGGWAREIEYAAWDDGNLSLDDDSGVAAQVRAGFTYNLGGSYDMQLGYRYFYAEPIDVTDLVGTDDGEIDVAQHSIEAIFRWGL
jgi:opacity protein-like surface antigen